MGRPFTDEDLKDFEDSFKNRNASLQQTFFIIITIAIVPQLVFFALRYFHQ